jgi:molybdenum cofactor cytidylyltransferase
MPLEEALHAVLAHSVAVADGRIKKGTRLTRDDLARLSAAGLQDVVAARLEPDDVAEDVAARTLADALSAPGTRVAAPFTGRCNLYAEHAGIAGVDARRILAVNSVDESITVATVAPWQAVLPRQMLATVKIIPFSVPRAQLESAVAAARAPSAAAAIGVRPFGLRSPTLIQTRLSGTRESLLDKTARVTAARMQALGSELAGEQRCDHAVDALRAAIGEAVSAGSDLILIVGASAIVDRRDVIPAAVEAGGGEVEHFGMPVDPGNLLLCARLADVPVLGLPGCARSPAFNGLDQVLAMIAAGHRVSRDDIVALGVGGLLKESPARPQSRREPAREPASQPRVAAVVLAAGQSRRMGAHNKLLMPVRGRPMLDHVLEAVTGCQAEWTLVVTGHEASRVTARLQGRDVIVLHNPDYEQGLSTSLITGLDALPAEADAVLVCLGDMPRVGAAALDRLIAAFDPLEGRGICVPTFNGKRGNPILWDRRYVPLIREVRGDVGARHLIGELAEQVVEIPMEDDAVLTDIDSPEALARLASGDTSP